MSRWRYGIATTVAVATMSTTSCAAKTDPPANPTGQAVQMELPRALRCMGRQLEKSTPPTWSANFYIDTIARPDKEKVQADIGAHIFAALSAIGARNERVSAVIWNDTANALQRSGVIEGPKLALRHPELSMAVLFSRLDENFKRSASSGGLRLPGLGGGIADDSQESELEVIVTLKTTYDQKQINGSLVRNQTIARRQGRGFDGEIGASIKSNLIGITYGASSNEDDRVGQKLGDLVTLTVAEAVGLYSGIPFWECLNVQRESRRADQLTHEMWSRKSAMKILAISRARLQVLGYLPATETMPMMPALAQFRQCAGIPEVNGVDYKTFKALILAPLKDQCIAAIKRN